MTKPKQKGIILSPRAIAHGVFSSCLGVCNDEQ